MATESIAVTRFREYLRVNTEQPKPDYEACKDFLFKYADELGIQRKAVETAPGVYFVIMTIVGSQPELPSIMLYSHTDVVPTFREHWTHDPYSAYKDEKGNIFARGTQDMKCVGVQYMEALRRHFARGKKQWPRTIHIVWGPDEETGHQNGMRGFCSNEEFKKLNVEFAFDEGIASETNVYKVFISERLPWWVKVTVPGRPGHGSKFCEDTALEKLHKLMTGVLKFRGEQESLLKSNPDWTLGDVTSSNMTIIKGGVQVNVVPEKFEAYIDMRVSPRQEIDQVKSVIDQWMKEAGPGATYEFLQSSDPSKSVAVDFSSFNGMKAFTPHTMDDPFWAAFETTLRQHKCEFKPEIFSASTDSRFLRTQGVRCIGFSPIINTTQLLHDHNEYLNENVFLHGVEIYESLIDSISNVVHSTPLFKK